MVVGLRKMHQRRGAGGGVRACGARERARARESAEGARDGERRGKQREGAERDSIADGTALRNIVGEEVAAIFRSLHHYDEGFFVFVAMLPTVFTLNHSKYRFRYLRCRYVSSPRCAWCRSQD